LSHALSVDLFQHHTRAPKWHDKEIQTNDFGSSSIKQAIPPRQKSKTYQASLAAAADVQHFQIFVRRICDIEAGFRSLPAAAAFRFSFWRRASRRGRPRCRRRHVRLLRQSGLAFSGSIIPEIERVQYEAAEAEAREAKHVPWQQQAMPPLEWLHWRESVRLFA